MNTEPSRNEAFFSISCDPLSGLIPHFGYVVSQRFDGNKNGKLPNLTLLLGYFGIY